MLVLWLFCYVLGLLFGWSGPSTLAAGADGNQNWTCLWACAVLLVASAFDAARMAREQTSSTRHVSHHEPLMFAAPACSWTWMVRQSRMDGREEGRRRALDLQRVL